MGGSRPFGGSTISEASGGDGRRSAQPAGGNQLRPDPRGRGGGVARRQLLVGQRRRVYRAPRALERHADRGAADPHALQIGIAPGRPLPPRRRTAPPPLPGGNSAQPQLLRQPARTTQFSTSPLPCLRCVSICAGNRNGRHAPHGGHLPPAGGRAGGRRRAGTKAGDRVLDARHGRRLGQRLEARPAGLRQDRYRHRIRQPFTRSSAGSSPTTWSSTAKARCCSTTSRPWRSAAAWPDSAAAITSGRTAAGRPTSWAAPGCSGRPSTRPKSTAPSTSSCTTARASGRSPGAGRG